MKVKDFFKQLSGAGGSAPKKSPSKGKSTSSKGNGSKGSSSGRKPPSKTPKAVKKKKARFSKKPDLRKIYKTTDGYFTGNEKIKKPRRVAVVEQRKDDGALAVVKMYSKKDKKGDMYINDLVLSPKKHSSLTEPSIVGNQIHIGVKKGGEYRPIYKNDFLDVGDSLTKKEHAIIKKKAGGPELRNRKTNKKKLSKWKNHFKK